MNQAELAELKSIHSALVEIAGRAPKRTIYVQGKAESSISVAVGQIAVRLEAMLPEPEEQPEPTA